MPKNNQTSIKKILKNRGIAGVQAPLPGPGPAPKLNQRNINHQQQIATRGQQKQTASASRNQDKKSEKKETNEIIDISRDGRDGPPRVAIITESAEGPRDTALENEQGDRESPDKAAEKRLNSTQRKPTVSSGIDDSRQSQKNNARNNGRLTSVMTKPESKGQPAKPPAPNETIKGLNREQSRGPDKFIKGRASAKDVKTKLPQPNGTLKPQQSTASLKPIVKNQITTKNSSSANVNVIGTKKALKGAQSTKNLHGERSKSPLKVNANETSSLAIQTGQSTRSKSRLPVLSTEEKQELFFQHIDKYNRKKTALLEQQANEAGQSQDKDRELESRIKEQLFKVSDFQVGLQIGQGAFAVVKRSTHKNTGHTIALKIYEKKNLSHESASLALHREIFVLATLTHPNIMRLYEVIDTRTHVHLVMELCHGRNLFHFVKKRKPDQRLPEPEAAHIFRQVVSAVAYMHSVKVVHRDLKLENILIDDAKNVNEIKIIDFGFATGCHKDERLTLQCGTAHYMCPDLAKKNSYLGHAADVWALGVILFILVTGKPPFYGEFEGDLFRRIQQAKYQFPDFFPDENRDRQQEDNQGGTSSPSPALRALIRKILEPNATHRIKAEQILEDPWLLQHCPPRPARHEEKPKFITTLPEVVKPKLDTPEVDAPKADNPRLKEIDEISAEGTFGEQRE